MELGRQDVRHFRVERLFVSPQGQRFVFGCYYARPHETFCDSTRLFHKNEVCFLNVVFIRVISLFDS